MPSSLLRRIGGTLLGLVVAMIVIAAIEMIGHIIWPPPPGLDPMNAVDATRIIAAMSGPALSMVLLGWFLGALAGGWTARRIARWGWAPWIVAAVIVAGGTYSFVTIPHPGWMIAAGVALPLLAALLISRRARE